jgi:hypothetical protein
MAHVLLTKKFLAKIIAIICTLEFKKKKPRALSILGLGKIFVNPKN